MDSNTFKALGALVIARLREFRREPSAFFFVLFTPILGMLVLGPAFSDRSGDVPLSDVRYVDFLIPGLLAVSILSTSVWGVGMTIVSNRKENVLKRLLATPMHAYQYILSHVIGRSAILLLEVGSQLLAGFLIFRFTVTGSLITYLLFALLGASTLTAFGIMLGSRTANTGAINGIANLVALPMMALSGAWFNRSHLPEWLAKGVKYLPLSPLVDGLRKIALEGAGFQDLAFEAGLLGLYFVVFSAVAVKAFKWY
jgi:ABC-2 type transport system permease protein